MSDTQFLGAFKKPLFTRSLIRRIQKIPDSMLFEPIVDETNQYIVEYDFDVNGCRFTIEREYSDCRLYAKTRNCPVQLIEMIKKAFIKR